MVNRRERHGTATLCAPLEPDVPLTAAAVSVSLNRSLVVCELGCLSPTTLRRSVRPDTCVVEHPRIERKSTFSMTHPKDPTDSPKRAGINPALASFATGVSTTIATIAVTLVSLRAQASRENLFLMLSWTMYVSAACAALVAGWILLDGIRRSLRELRHLSELEAHVPRLIRCRRWSEQVRISIDGDAFIQRKWELESAPGASVPWLTFPIFASVDPGGPEWKGFAIQRASVDGIEFDPVLALTKKMRSRILSNPRFGHIVLEEGAVRAPIGLQPKRRRCTLLIETKLPGSYAAILAGDQEDDFYIADVAYVTDEIDLYIEGADKLRICCSPLADYRVQAGQFSGELLDTVESQLQSANCDMKGGVRWRSTNAKIGYRYEIPISAQRHAE